jgi:hypothetical protein
MEQLAAKSREASQLRQRRSQIARQFGIPQTLIGGSLSVSRRRCGKQNCRCASGPGHPQWALTFSNRGTRRVEKLPSDWAEALEQAVLDSQDFLDAIKEVMAINMELLSQTKKQRQQRGNRPDVRPAWKRMKKRSTFSPADRSSTM